MILAGYIAQANLTKRALTLIPELHDIDSKTIDDYQGKEKSITILYIIGSQKLGFIAISSRLPTEVSRAANSLAIITKDIELHPAKKIPVSIAPNVSVDIRRPTTARSRLSVARTTTSRDERIARKSCSNLRRIKTKMKTVENEREMRV